MQKTTGLIPPAHGALALYDAANNNVGGSLGGEIRGNIIPKVDIFFAGDAILRAGPNFFLIHGGFIIGL